MEGRPRSVIRRARFVAGAVASVGGLLVFAAAGQVDAYGALTNAATTATPVPISSYATLQSDVDGLSSGSVVTYQLAQSLSAPGPSGYSDSGLVVPDGASVTIDLYGWDLTINDPGHDSSGAGYAGIEVGPGSSLTIEDTSSTAASDAGVLTVDGSAAVGSYSGGGAGIGGSGGDGNSSLASQGEQAGLVTVAGGDVVAQGGNATNGGAGAGIGGGGGGTSSSGSGAAGGAGGQFQITGGSVSPVGGGTTYFTTQTNYQGGGGAAAIGGGGGGETGGTGGTGGQVNVSGGEIFEADGGEGETGGAALGGGGAGVGGGGGDGGQVSVTAGTIDGLVGGGGHVGGGAGIGGGGNSGEAGGSGALVEISGGKVETVEGGWGSQGGGGAGVGGGGAGSGSSGGAGAQVQITGGNLQILVGGAGGVASGGGAGVGGGGGYGSGGDGGPVLVSGGTLDTPEGAPGGNTGGVGSATGGGGAGIGGGGSGASSASGAGSAITVEAGTLTNMYGGGAGGAGASAGAGTGAGGSGTGGTIGSQGSVTVEPGTSMVTGEVAGTLTIDSGAVVSVPFENILQIDDPNAGQSVNNGTVALAGAIVGNGVFTNSGAITVSGSSWALDGHGPGYPNGYSQATVTGNVFDLHFVAPQGLTAPSDLWVFAPTFALSGETLPTAPTEPGYTSSWTSGGVQITTNTALAQLANSSGLISVDDTLSPILPTITAVASSAGKESPSGWWDASVTITFACTSAPGTTIVGGCPAPTVLTANGAGQSVAKSIQSSNGGTAQTALSGINIDTTHPTVRIAGVTSHRTYTKAPHPTCVAHDPVSGVASCQLTTTRKKHSSVTTVTISALAVSRAGLTSVTKLSYSLKTKRAR